MRVEVDAWDQRERVEIGYVARRRPRPNAFLPFSAVKENVDPIRMTAAGAVERQEVPIGALDAGAFRTETDQLHRSRRW